MAQLEFSLKCSIWDLSFKRKATWYVVFTVVFVEFSFHTRVSRELVLDVQ